MLTRLIHYWEFLRNSYWLVPAIMLLAVIGISYGLLAVDARLDLNQYRGLKWLIFSTAEGARAVLSTIAASTFAAATLTFSVTMVTLSLTSSQFGPRLLRNFLRDPINQFTFGAFISTFIYCLLIMRGLVVNGNRIPNISRALSPSINDPFTAMACIDYLGIGLAAIAGRDLPAAQIRNKQGRLLLIKKKLTFLNICDACFTIIRQMSNDNPPVVIYLLETLGQLAAIVKRQEDREAVLQTAKLTVNSAIGKCEMDYDRRAILQRFEQVETTLELNFISRSS